MFERFLIKSYLIYLKHLGLHETDIESIATKDTPEPTVKVKCLTGFMLITIKDAPLNPKTGAFSGMIYPKGLSKNTTCLTEYR